MKYLMIAFFFLMSFPVYAQENRLELDIVQFARGYCLESTRHRIGADELAVRRGVPELPPQQAAIFAPEGGRVFAFKEHTGKIVLIYSKTGACIIAAREFNSEKLWKEVDRWFGGDKNIRMDDEVKSSFAIERKYFDTLKDKILVAMNIRNETTSDQIQGKILVARYREE